MSGQAKETSFQENYLACAAALDALRIRLMHIGMSGNKNFDRLCADFIEHGGETHRDINSHG